MNSKHIIIGIFALLTVISGTYILSNAYKYKYKSIQTITVTGNAKMDFESDLVTWNAQFSRTHLDLKVASELLKADRKIIESYLSSQGVDRNEMRFGAIDIRKDYEYVYDNKGRSQQQFTGYVLSQVVGISSRQLDKVDNISREISTLLSQGIELISRPANYYHTRLEDLKLELIANASENARQRAENIAKKANAKIGELVKADLGVFQITGLYEDEEYSYGGTYNTTSRNKTANITVKMHFRSN